MAQISTRKAKGTAISSIATSTCLQGGLFPSLERLACGCGGRLVLHAVVRPPATLDVLESLERSALRRARAPPMAS